jgi:hypothetical protein
MRPIRLPPRVFAVQLPVWKRGLPSEGKFARDYLSRVRASFLNSLIASVNSSLWPEM